MDVLCRGTEFSEAYRIVRWSSRGKANAQASRFDRAELVEDLIHPALEEAQEALVEVFDEMEGQLDKEMKRLAELQRIRVTDPGEQRWPAESAISRSSQNPWQCTSTADIRHILPRRQ